MTGRGHSWTGFAVAAAVYKFSIDYNFSPLLAVGAFLIGVTAPDWLELRRKSGGTLIKHRTITHWLPVWVFMFITAFFFREISSKFNISELFIFNSVNVYYYISSFFIGFSLGGLLHLLTDIPNPMGIPILTPNRRFSFKLWNSGKYEVAITFVLFIITMSYVGVLNFNFSILDKYLAI